MNCADVVHFLVEPDRAPGSVKEHLNTCETCRAHAAESRRVAAAMAELPFTPAPDLAAQVMSRIGFGNGRPTKDKIVDQLERIREELEKLVGDLDPSEAQDHSVDGEPSIDEILAAMPRFETTLLLEAELACTDGAASAITTKQIHNGELVNTPPASVQGASSFSRVASDADSALGEGRLGSGDEAGTGSAAPAGRGFGHMEELRRVRERTLRVVSELGLPDLGGRAAELFRTIYRNEAERVSQIEDLRWRARRIEELRRST